MVDKIYRKSSIIMRDKYGWKLHQNDNIKVWFCGYQYNNSIEVMLNNISSMLHDSTTTYDILHWINNIDGHFAIVVETSEWTIAAVDKICSIPLFFINNGDILISNYAPSLKTKCKLDNNDLDEWAGLEIAMSGYTIAGKTLYNGLKRLEAGECMLLNQGSYCTEYYHTYSPWKTVDKSPGQFQSEFLDICLSTLKKIKNSVGDRQIVIPLSAGNDSRLVASGLKEIGVKNVVCFSYGRKGNFETPTSKAIANKLGYRWIYIPDRLKDKRRFFKSKVYRQYVDAFESFSYIPNVQEVYEIFLLQKTNLVNDDAIIINGSCGDFISGGHIRPTLDMTHTPKSIDEISWNKFLDKHFSLWGCLRVSDNDAYIVSELKRIFSSRIKDSIDLDKYQYAIMEYSEYIGRQSKIVMGQQRAYEFCGYEWRTPLWSDEMLNFWQSVPYEHKVDQRLYIKSLQESNWGGVWRDIEVNDKVINPASLRWIRNIVKILFFPLGKEKWHRFEKNVFEYWLHPSYALTVVPYLNVLFDKRGHRNTNAWVSYRMLELRNLSYIFDKKKR
jgi:asparagine synthase (glutamine-hydrolysing)